jgi:CBS domain-containing protein
MNTINVNCIGIENVDTARADESVWLAAERMHQRVVGALVVVNEIRQPMGIVTDRDLVERVLTKRRDVDETLVGEVMTTDLETIDESASLETAMTKMRQGQFRRLPIVDNEGRLTGLICLDDVLMYFARGIAAIGQVLRSETPRAVADEPLMES